MIVHEIGLALVSIFINKCYIFVVNVCFCCTLYLIVDVLTCERHRWQWSSECDEASDVHGRL